MDSCLQAMRRDSCLQATRRDSCLQAMRRDCCLQAMRRDSCLRATRENSWRQQPRELIPKTQKERHTLKTTADRQKTHNKGMSTENNIGVQTRAMAQWVDNDTNPEQVQTTTDQATTPTVELHKTKECTRPLQH